MWTTRKYDHINNIVRWVNYIKKKKEENENINYLFSTNICNVSKQKNIYIKLIEKNLFRDNNLIFLKVMTKKF